MEGRNLQLENFKIPAWSMLAIGVGIHTAIGVSFVYSTFETVLHARERIEAVHRQQDETATELRARLERIENKLDRLYELERRTPAGR